MSGNLRAAALAVLLAVALVGCGSSSERQLGGQQQGVSEVLEEQMGEGQEAPATSGAFVGDAEPAYAEDEVEVDLTTMNADMVYATVYDMTQNPGDYRGRVVRMTGPYYHSYLEETGNDYYYVIIQDATACCAQGLEFVWGAGDHAYPDDYPADGTQVVVCGRFETYEENGVHYAHLVDASLMPA